MADSITFDTLTAVSAAGGGTMPALVQRNLGVNAMPAMRGFGRSPSRGYGIMPALAQRSRAVARMPVMLGYAVGTMPVNDASYGIGVMPTMGVTGAGHTTAHITVGTYGQQMPGFGGRGFGPFDGGFTANNRMPAMQGAAMQFPDVLSLLTIFQTPGYLYSTASSVRKQYAVSLTEALGFTDTSAAQYVRAYIERLGLAATTSNLIDAMAAITEGIGFRGVVHYVWKFLFAEGLGLGDDLAARRAYMVDLADALALHGGGSSQLDAQAVVAEALALGALHGFVLPFTYAEGLGLGDTQAAQLAALHTAMDTLALADSPSMSLGMSMLVAEGLALGDAGSHTAALQFAFAEDIGFMVRVHLDDGLYVAWVFHAESRAFTEYRNYPFNSFCRMPDNTYYGAMADGIYRLDGDDDAGTSIEARIRGGLEQFGTARAKRLPEMFLGYRASGDMVLKVIVTSEAGAKQEHWYKVIPRAAGATRESRVKIGRGLKSVYYGWELANVDGADFALDEIAFHPMILERRIT